MVACGIVLVVVDWVLLQSENATTKEMNQIYRWNFDIRLGMYSPEWFVCWRVRYDMGAHLLPIPAQCPFHCYNTHIKSHYVCL